MLSAKVFPESYQTKTYGSAGFGRDYVELEFPNWCSDTANDLVTAQNGEVLVCYNDKGSEYNDGGTIKCANTNTDYFRVVMSANGHKPKGKLYNGFYFRSNNKSLTLSENYIGMYDIANINNMSATIPFYLSTANYCKLVNCISHIKSNSGNCYKIIGGGNVFVNSIASTNSQNGYGFYEFTNVVASNRYFNCLTYYLSVPFTINVSIHQPIATNCIVENCLTDFHAYFNQTNCIKNQNLTYIDPTYDDYDLHLSDIPGNSLAIGKGTDLRNDPYYPFGEDFDGDGRGTIWDIGPDQITPDDTSGWQGSFCGISEPGLAIGILSANLDKILGI